MQQIQRTILNTIRPGNIPIFIIAPTINDGEELALLLSNHIITKLKNTNFKNLKEDNNFFSNPETKQFLPTTLNIKNIDDYRTTIKLIVDSGFDTGKLWGLQIDYELFFTLEIYNLYPHATFLFLYHQIIYEGIDSSSIKYLSKINIFFEEHRSNSILLSIENVTQVPNAILRVLPWNSDIVVKDFNDIRTNSFSNLNNFTAIDSYEFVSLIASLHSNNTLANNEIWFRAQEILIVLIADNRITKDALRNKILQFSYSFAGNVLISIICETIEIENIIKSFINNEPYHFISLKICRLLVSTAFTINELISNTLATYIIVDDLTLSYSPAILLQPFKLHQPPDFVFGRHGMNKKENLQQLNLVDTLLLTSYPCNLAFTKKDWQKVNGFDKKIHYNLSVWDFCIRLLESSQNYGLEVDAYISLNLLSSSSKLNDDDYVIIIQKHKKLFEFNLNQVITIAARHQHVPQQEIIKLNHEINTFLSLQNHTKHEITSLVNQRHILQQQINLMESRWHFKVVRKLNHFKKIFFKESSSGKTGILKVLKFVIFSFTRPGFRLFRRVLKALLRKLYLITEDRSVEIIYLDQQNDDKTIIRNYDEWIKNKLNINVLRSDYNEKIGTFNILPKVSIIMPVYNPPVAYLKAAIDSALDQLYVNIELCIADDCSTDPIIKRLLDTYALKDKRVKVVFRKENGHISASSNSALALATGEYVLCLDHDDLLTSNCVFELVKYINANPQVEIIYSDEDKIDDTGIFSNPYFKPDFAPDNLLAKNYITHITAYKKTLIDSLGGYKLGFEGSQDYDLLLRATEVAKGIGHIPLVLYHWRIHAASASQTEEVKPYAFIAAKKAIEEALIRRNTPGEVYYLAGLKGYGIRYKIKSYKKVSIIIPTKDQFKLMKNTIESLISLTDYPDYEIIVLDNNSETDEFFQLMNEYSEKYGDIFRCIKAKFPFNFSKLMNVGVQHSNGDYVLMLNNDVEILHGDWLRKMVSYAQQERIGAVGVKLLYPDDNIQHAGTVIGLGGIAGHVFVHQYKDDPGYFNYLQSTTNYSAVTAACLMCRKEVFNKVAGMDESLEVEFNDVDFCLKILDEGYYNIYIPEVVLYHYESATRGHPHQTKVSYERHIREMEYFKTKWDKYIKKDPFYNPNLTLDRQDFSINLKS